MEEKAHDKKVPYFLWKLFFFEFGIPKVHKCVETIQGRKLFKGENYSRATYTI